MFFIITRQSHGSLTWCFEIVKAIFVILTKVFWNQSVLIKNHFFKVLLLIQTLKLSEKGVSDLEQGTEWYSNVNVSEHSRNQEFVFLFLCLCDHLEAAVT